MSDEVKLFLEMAVFDNYRVPWIDCEFYLTITKTAEYLSELFETEVKQTKLRSAIRSRKLATNLHPLTGWYLIKPKVAIEWYASTKMGQMHAIKKGVWEKCLREVKLSK